MTIEERIQILETGLKNQKSRRLDLLIRACERAVSGIGQKPWNWHEIESLLKEIKANG